RERFTPRACRRAGVGPREKVNMGSEAQCTARFNRKTAAGKARLETEVLQFRGNDLRLSIPFKDISKITARGGTLSVTFSGGTASLDLGPAAEKWADK